MGRVKGGLYIHQSHIVYPTEGLQHLDGVSEDIAKVSSRSLKELLGGSFSPSTWTRSVNLALNDEYNHSWIFIGQSFIRRDAAFYGFVVEGGATTEDINSA